MVILDSTWSDLILSDTFSQLDITENRIQYQHDNILGTKGTVG